MKKEIKLFVSVLVLVTVAITLFANSVKAMNSASIDKQIIIAQEKLETVENKLLCKNTGLFLTYKYNRYSDLGGYAETALREKYPEEYWEYIEAKSQLDDLRYLQFMGLVNGMSESK